MEVNEDLLKASSLNVPRLIPFLHGFKERQVDWPVASSRVAKMGPLTGPDGRGNGLAVSGADLHRAPWAPDTCTVIGRTHVGTAEAGNEVGITGARKCALPLWSAHMCAGFICGNMEMPWWRGCGCFPGGQGVAGSNPAVPTVFRTLVPRNGNENCHDH